VKRKKSKSATIIAAYSTDLQLALRWAKLNKALKSVGELREIGSKLEKRYAVTVKLRTSKSELSTLLKNRFGVFIKVV
tara:strand:+ start:88 stop:321 length:234 start_codon:yes stop_codon:yes gene_type:complete